MDTNAGRVSPSLYLADAPTSRAARDLVLFPDSNWEAVFAADEHVPDMETADVVRCMGAILRRQHFFEEERRKERLIIEELVKENKELKRKIGDVEGAMAQAVKGALYCAGIPKYEPSPLWSPRAMSIPEAQWLQETLEGFKHGDERLREVQKIAAAVPRDGVVVIELQALEPRQQWQLYYYLRHRKLYKKTSLSPRGQKTQDLIEESTGSPAVVNHVGDWSAWEPDDGGF